MEVPLEVITGCGVDGSVSTTQNNTEQPRTAVAFHISVALNTVFKNIWGGLDCWGCNTFTNSCPFLNPPGG